MLENLYDKVQVNVNIIVLIYELNKSTMQNISVGIEKSLHICQPTYENLLRSLLFKTQKVINTFQDYSTNISISVPFSGS